MKLFNKIKLWWKDALVQFSFPKYSLSQFTLPQLPSFLTPLRTHLLCCVTIIFSFACLVLLGITMITEMSRAALASRVADQVLRFHVIANSDSSEDQALKLEVRDALISYMADHRTAFDSADEAAAFAADHCHELTQLAQAIIDQAGFSYTASASVTVCPFPEKTYGDLTFPAGDYQALRVELGQAQGQNWWCVLYPLLCFTEEGMVAVPEESQEILQENLSQADYRHLCSQPHPTASHPVNSATFTFRFWFLEWIQSALSQRQ